MKLYEKFDIMTVSTHIRRIPRGGGLPGSSPLQIEILKNTDFVDMMI
jgi:hypothetical protein